MGIEKAKKIEIILLKKLYHNTCTRTTEFQEEKYEGTDYSSSENAELY